MSPFRAIAARWLPLARKAAGLAEAPESATGRAWDKGTPQDRRLLAMVAQAPNPEEVATQPWVKVSPALRPIIAVRARKMHEWLGAFVEFDARDEANK